MITPIVGKYKKTGLTNFNGQDNIILETGWNDLSVKRGLLKIKINDEETVVSFGEILTNLMIHAQGEKQETDISKNFYEKSKGKRIIDYQLNLIASEDIKKGSPIRATVQLEVPEELLNMDFNLRKFGNKRKGLV